MIEQFPAWFKLQNTELRRTPLARNILLIAIFAILLWGFAVSPEFKEIAAGVAIFLFGMMALEDGFRAFSGGVLEKFLKASTDSLGKSLAFGVVSTTLMQSSSLVSVLTISFLSSGLITLAAGIGIIFGSNLGTTTGAWLVAGVGLKVDIAAFALPMIVFGVILVFQNAKALKGAGYVLAGVGFLFLGIDYMKTGFSTFQESLDLSQYAMTGFAGVLVYALIGVFATVVMQSSHATLILSITALAAGQITYENSLAIAIGANVGTTVTAVIGSLSADVNGKRLALAHLVFNLTTAAIAIAFINQLAVFVDNISAFVGIAEDDYTLKFATFHTVFNVIGVAIMIPFIGKLTEALMRLAKEPKREVSEPYFLNEAALEFPDTAIKTLAAEAVHVFSNCVGVICEGLGLNLDEIRAGKDPAQVVADYGPPADVNIDLLYSNKIKELHNAFEAFAIRSSETALAPEQSVALDALKRAIRDGVQAVKDVKHLQKNLLVYSRSDHTEMRREYDTMRIGVARILRAIVGMREDPERSKEQLQTLYEALRNENIVENGTLDQMIRENKITSQMATSLINDSSYALSVSRRILDAVLMVHSDGLSDLIAEARTEFDSHLSGMEARAVSDR